MVAYKFYWRDPVKGYQLIGILPARRNNPLRITRESIMNLGKKIFGSKMDIDDILFIQVTIDDSEVLQAHKVFDSLSDIEYII